MAKLTSIFSDKQIKDALSKLGYKFSSVKVEIYDTDRFNEKYTDSYKTIEICYKDAKPKFEKTSFYRHIETSIFEPYDSYKIFDREFSDLLLNQLIQLKLSQTS